MKIKLFFPSKKENFDYYYFCYARTKEIFLLLHILLYNIEKKKITGK